MLRARCLASSGCSSPFLVSRSIMGYNSRYKPSTLSSNLRYVSKRFNTSDTKGDPNSNMTEIQKERIVEEEENANATGVIEKTYKETLMFFNSMFHIFLIFEFM